MMSHAPDADKGAGRRKGERPHSPGSFCLLGGLTLRAGGLWGREFHLVGERWGLSVSESRLGLAPVSWTVTDLGERASGGSLAAASQPANQKIPQTKPPKPTDQTLTRGMRALDPGW